MADILKKVNRITHTLERSLSITQNDVISGDGDIILVEDSLGRKARKAFIEANDELGLRFNVYQRVFPRREGSDLMTTAHLPNLALGGTVIDRSGMYVYLEAGESFETDSSFPIGDIELDTISGQFTIILT